MVEEYPEHDMPREFLVSLSRTLLDVTTENIINLLLFKL